MTCDLLAPASTALAGIAGVQHAARSTTAAPLDRRQKTEDKKKRLASQSFCLARSGSGQAVVSVPVASHRCPQQPT
jgi:hypothetical protein